jgi:uncharacterized membrane protein
MSAASFSMSESIRFGWNTMSRNIGFFIGLFIVAFLIENIPGILGQMTERTLPVISLIFSLAAFVLGLVVQMGLIKISVQFCDNIKGKIADLVSTFHLILKYIAGSILYGLIVFGGLLLLIVPGIIWGIKFGLFPYFIVDREVGPIDALKASAKATDGAKWGLFLFGFLIGLINIVGMLVFFVGLFATVPATMVAYAHVYRTLSAKAGVVGTNSKNVMYVDLGV